MTAPLTRQSRRPAALPSRPVPVPPPGPRPARLAPRRVLPTPPPAGPTAPPVVPRLVLASPRRSSSDSAPPTPRSALKGARAAAGLPQPASVVFRPADQFEIFPVSPRELAPLRLGSDDEADDGEAIELSDSEF